MDGTGVLDWTCTPDTGHKAGVGRDRRRRKKNCYFLLVSSDAGANGAGLIDL
eukprot:COSAG02_NODE_4537_length_5239_cov_3.381712_5_plen_52_part_00